MVAESGLFTPADLARLAASRRAQLPDRRKPDAAGRCRPPPPALSWLIPYPQKEPPDVGLTHFDAAGQAHMVDVSDKEVTDRIAVAEGYVKMRPETLEIITEGRAKKGDVLSVARLGWHHGCQEDIRADPALSPPADHQGRAGADRRPCPPRRAGRGDGQDHAARPGSKWKR